MEVKDSNGIIKCSQKMPLNVVKKVSVQATTDAASVTSGNKVTLIGNVSDGNGSFTYSY